MTKKLNTEYSLFGNPFTLTSKQYYLYHLPHLSFVETYNQLLIGKHRAIRMLAMSFLPKANAFGM